MIKGGGDAACALLDRPVHSPYRDYGLALSRQAFEGPGLDEYPALGGARLRTQIEGLDVSSPGEPNKRSTVTFVHTITVSGGWSGFSAAFSREGTVHRIKKFFGKAEAQGGDPIFDDNVFVHGDASDPLLARFIALEGAQSALLELLMDRGDRVEVSVDEGTVELVAWRSSQRVEYRELVLPALALAYWAREATREADR